MRRFHEAATRGSATIVMMTGIGVVAMATALALAMGLATQTRHRAGAAADAAALAAASSAIDGPLVACARALELAARNGALLVGCLVVDGIADVTVAVEPPRLLAAFGPTTARARAGPASAAGE
jgi:secretion/DNA translocation related TadE-like protein